MSSSAGPDHTWIGFVAAAISVVGFGTTFAPAKKFNSGDGFFYQWVMCTAILFGGLGVYIFRGFPKFEPMAMAGGALWATGNACAIPIIQMIGLALGMSVWGVSNLAVGWASGTFGILGVGKQKVSKPILNYIGAGVAVCSVILYSLVSSNAGKKESGGEPGEYEVLADKRRSKRLGHLQEVEGGSDKYEDDDGSKESLLFRLIKKLGPTPRRVVGITLSLLSGCMYGANFNPPQWRIDHGGSSKEVLDYVFPHFVGIFSMSTLLFVIYAIANKNVPAINPRLVLPGIVSGAIWAISQIGWFVANSYLSFPVSFPIITSGPAVIASIWGVLVFREIRGKWQIMKLISAILVTIIGVVLISLSKLLK